MTIMRYFAIIAILLINSFASSLFAAEYKSSDDVFGGLSFRMES